MVLLFSLTPLLLEADAGSVPCHFVSTHLDWPGPVGCYYHTQRDTYIIDVYPI